MQCLLTFSFFFTKANLLPAAAISALNILKTLKLNHRRSNHTNVKGITFGLNLNNCFFRSQLCLQEKESLNLSCLDFNVYLLLLLLLFPLWSDSVSPSVTFSFPKLRYAFSCPAHLQGLDATEF